ncbi:MAG: RNA polymerase sigma factor, partial [Solirubrobacterales bacterium]
MSESAGTVPVPPIRSRWGLNRDLRLAELAAAGDERAFEALFRRYHQELYRYCRAIVNDPADAEDAMQATMVKALRSLPGERREISLKPWLYRVAHNESISILRSRRTTVELDAEQLPALDSVETTADMRGRVRTLVADLETLPERQRASLVMRELNGLSYDEIGAALAMSPAASRQAVFEARTALLEVAEGREMECRYARETISAGDRRVLRGRKLRAHLRGCEGCSDFEAAIRERRETLAALAPPLAAPAALAVLHGAIGAGSTGTGVLA